MRNRKLTLTAMLSLYPTPEQVGVLRRTMTEYLAAADAAARIGFAAKTFHRAPLHRLAYHRLREMGFTASVADAGVKRTAMSFLQDRTRRPVFRQRSMPLMGKTVSLRILPRDRVAFRASGSRVHVDFKCSEHQRAMLADKTSLAELAERDGRFFLRVVCNVASAAPFTPSDFLGVDLGVAQLATTSDGQIFTGAIIETVRVRHENRRRRLCREATRQRRKGRRPKNVRRALNRLGRAESRFRRDVNHCITKKVVRLAEGTKRGIAVENLTGIRSRIRFAKSQRAKMGGWAFAQWQAFCAYKARRAGVPFVVVNPAYTSQTCHACGHRDKDSRLDQARFVCIACGHSAHADVNAAQNIAARAHVEAPMLAESPQGIAA